jgi:hypothetical protein
LETTIFEDFFAVLPAFFVVVVGVVVVVVVVVLLFQLQVCFCSRGLLSFCPHKMATLPGMTIQKISDLSKQMGLVTVISFSVFLFLQAQYQEL